MSNRTTERTERTAELIEAGILTAIVFTVIFTLALIDILAL
jgi:hypothetical protein